MATLATIVEQMRSDGTIDTIMRNPSAQFGRPARRYLGATLLPEVMKPKNEYREESIRFRTVVASDGTRYSPAQLRAGELFASFLVELGNSDIKRELNGQDYDALLRYLDSQQDMSAIAAVTQWLDTTVNLAHAENAERQRWEAIVGAAVSRVGDNNYVETVNYSNPGGHRAAAAAAWSTNTTDIWDNIHVMGDLLKSKGYSIGRIVTSTAVVGIMAKNATVKSRAGHVIVNTTGQIQGAPGRASAAAINATLSEDGLPPIEVYDLQFRNQTATKRFMPANVMCFFAAGDRDPALDFGDNEELFNFGSIIGYHAVGVPAGHGTPGRVVDLEVKTNKPPRIIAESWMTHLPVITEPEGMAVITGIA